MTALVLPFGAIAEARVRQRRRRIVGGLAILALAAAAGVGAYAFSAHRHSSPRFAIIQVLATKNASVAELTRISGASRPPHTIDEFSRQGLIDWLQPYIKPDALTHDRMRTQFFIPMLRADVGPVELRLRSLPGVARFRAIYPAPPRVAR